MNIITIALTIALLIVFLLLTILFIKYKKLSTNFNNYDPNPIFGPGRYNYGINDPHRISKEMRIERIRNILTFKWIWYWTTKKYRKERKTRKEFSKLMVLSIEKKKKAKLLRELNQKKNNE